jgi:hypothetical protein
MRRDIVKRAFLGASAMLALAATLSRAQAQEDPTALAKKTQNPVGDLISFPLQFNFNTGGGFGDATFYNLNFQPVVPIKLSPKWNVIARTIVPFVSLPGATPADRARGIGDIQEQLFLSPAQPGGVIWGVGAALSFPTATNDLARTGAWAAGPTAVALTMTGPWVIGLLASQFWTYHDEGGSPEVNQFVTQPFINYNFGKGWALSTSPLITANWDAPDGEQWTVPVGLGLTRTTQFQRRPISIGVQYYHNVEQPTSAAANQLRFTLSLLFPSGPKPAGR